MSASNQSVKRGISILVAVVVMVSVSGFFVGLRQIPDDVAASRSWENSPSHSWKQSDRKIPQALSYAEMAEKKLGPNRDFRPEITGLKQVSITADDLKKIN